jgi:hypothetical protein
VHNRLRIVPRGTEVDVEVQGAVRPLRHGISHGEPRNEPNSTALKGCGRSLTLATHPRFAYCRPL